MATLKKYSLDGAELGDVSVDTAIADFEANGQMIKDYIVAIRNNARQWSANTKSRGEVSHSTQKPHRQKGSGKARQGRLSSPQYKGGGVVFGPKPKFDQHTGINRKERRAAIRSLIAEKVRNGQIKVVDSMSMEAPKTKTVVKFLETTGTKGRVLFLSEGAFAEVETEGVKSALSVKSDAHRNFALSVSNIPKTAHSLVKNISGYDVAVAQEIVITESGLAEMTEWLK